MKETTLSSSKPDRKEERMAPAAGTALKRVEESQDNSSCSNSNDELQISSSISSYHSVTFPTQALGEDMPKEQAINGRIKVVFGLALLAALSSLAGQLRIFGLTDVLGVLGAMALIAVAVVVAVPQLRRNFRTSP